MPLKSGLTPRQALFAAEYLKDLDATKAAIRAKYSARTAAEIGYENLRKPHIAAAIAAGQAERSKRVDLSADRVLEEIRRLALSDIGEIFDDAGGLLPIKQLPPEIRACISSVEVRSDADGNQVTKVRLWNKGQQLELAAKHLELLVNRVEVTGEIELRVSRMTEEQRAGRAKALVDQVRALCGSKK